MAKICEICNKKLGLFEQKYKSGKYNILCKECYAKEVNRKRQEIIANENIIKENFKTEMMHSFFSLSHPYLIMNGNVVRLERRLRKKINEGLFHSIILEMYKDINNVKSINQIRNKFLNVNYIKYIVNRMVSINYRNIENKQLPLDVTIGQIKSVVELYEKFYIDKAMKDIMICTDLNILEKGIKESSNGMGDEDINYFAGIYTYAFGFIKLIILFRNIDDFLNNKELYTMYMNMLRGTNLKSNEVAQKLFPIYDKMYNNTFPDRYRKDEFSNFIIILSEHISSIKLRELTVLKEEILQFNNDSKSTDSDIKVKFENFLEKLDDKKYFEYRKIPYVLDSKNSNITLIMLRYYILLNVGKNIPSYLFFDFLIDKDNKYFNIFKRKLEKESLMKEKERLLKGDFSKEKVEEIDKLNFDNIQTGYEFESYLKNVFDKLGYKSIVTKSSGDQGADLVIEKDNNKTVVQAKFYSSPVGNKAIQEVVAAEAFYNAENGMVVTNNVFTNAAIELAEVNNIKLVDGSGLNNLRNKIIEKI